MAEATETTSEKTESSTEEQIEESSQVKEISQDKENLKAEEVSEAKETAEPEVSSESDGTEQVQVRSAGFPEAGASEDIGKGSIDMILNMSVPVTVCIGQTQISIQRLLQLGHGSVIKLEKPINEPMELYLNGSKFATGEVVVIDDQFAVRIKNIVDMTGIEAEEEKA
jgi:flagellar motor switch protein FliN